MISADHRRDRVRRTLVGLCPVLLAHALEDATALGRSTTDVADMIERCHAAAAAVRGARRLAKLGSGTE